jgi:hypothetical protein
MASTIAFYTGDGATTDFTVPFDYLAKKFVRVSLGVAILKGGDYGDTSKDYYFLDKTKVRLKVPPQEGEVLTIRRYTSATDRVVSFKDASVLKATDLNVSSVQTIHIAEEARDIINDALIKDKEGNWDAKGNRIVNVGTPEADSDAMTYGVYKADALGAYQSKLDAERARDRAVEAETNSKKSEENAKLSEVNAQASAGTAVSASKHADAVKVENQAILQEAKEIRDENKVLDANTKDNANVAQVKANEAKVSETNAKKSEVNSKESEGNAKVSEGKASASAELAKQWATKLGATVDGTEYSAKYYANKANEVLTQVATDVVNRVTAEGTKQVGLVSNQGTTSVNAVKTQQTASVNAVVTQQGTSVKAVQTQQTTSVNAVTAEGTKQVGLVSTEGTKQVDLAKAQVTLATQSASTATAKATIATQQATLATTKASEAEDSATAASADATKAKDSATNAANSAGTATTQATAASNSAKAAKLSADNAALSKTAAGTSEVNAKASEVEAKKQADIAKQYADQAVAGQLQADWAQTNSTKYDFIKNKPTLGTLSAKNSLAYSELTGVPSSFTPSSHTHPISQITNLQASLDAKTNDATLQVDLTAIRESIANVSSKVDGIGDTLSPTYAKKQAILDACDKALNSTNPVNAGDPTFINQLAEKLSKLGTVRPLGFHYLHPYETAPADSIICNGATYSRALYKDFFDYITTQGWVKTEAEWQEIATIDNGFCPFYSDGDGSTNFRTPKFAPYQQIALASSSVGKYPQAGLPNITGSVSVSGGENDLSRTSGTFVNSGALTASSTTTTSWSGYEEVSGRHWNKLSISASNSDKTYGRSSTVQPESHEWVMCVVAYGIATNVGSVDIQNVMSAVNAVQANLTQIESDIAQIPQPSAYVTKTWGSGTQWYRRWSNGWIEQGGHGSGSTCTFPLVFSDTNYTFVVQHSSGYDSHPDWLACYENRPIRTTSTTGITSYMSDSGWDWYACGY